MGRGKRRKEEGARIGIYFSFNTHGIQILSFSFFHPSVPRLIPSLSVTRK